MRSGIAIFISFLFLSQLQAQVKPLPNAHAHNDYLHQKPLQDALSHGFTSIEADIHLIDGELYVAHDKPISLDGISMLKDLYLEPLRKLTAQQNGYVYTGYKKPVYLMIDIKTEGEATYILLKQQLIDYQKILRTRNNPTGAVQIVLSGNRPVETVKKEASRLVAIDGRPSDLTHGYDSDFMPVISQHYLQVIKWSGEGEIPAYDLQALKNLTEQTHKQGKKLRLWATPEKENVWKVLLEAGVDFINTDKLQELQNFLSKKD